MNDKYHLIIDLSTYLFIFIAVFICSYEVINSVISSTLLEEVSLSLKSDFVRETSLSKLCPREYSTINLGSWPGTMKGCDCVGVGGLTTLFDSEVQQKQCSKGERKGGCHTIQPIPKENYTFWRNMQFCSKYPVETTDELKYLEYLKNSVKKGGSCPQGFKQCGILDTLDNILCLPENEECPLNFFVITNNATPPTEYQYLNITTLSFQDVNGTYLHYSNEAINNPIIVHFEIAETGHLCIDPNEKYSSKCTFFTSHSGCMTPDFEPVLIKYLYFLCILHKKTD